MELFGQRQGVKAASMAFQAGRSQVVARVPLGLFDGAHRAGGHVLSAACCPTVYALGQFELVQELVRRSQQDDDPVDDGVPDQVVLLGQRPQGFGRQWPHSDADLLQWWTMAKSLGLRTIGFSVSKNGFRRDMRTCREPTCRRGLCRLRPKLPCRWSRLLCRTKLDSWMRG